MATKKPKKRKSKAGESAVTVVAMDPVTLEEAQQEVQTRIGALTAGSTSRRSSARARRSASPNRANLASVGAERKKLEQKHNEEIEARILEYNAVFAILR